MKVLVACEFSGIVRDAFIRAGHDAMSCDVLPSERPWNPHHQGDVRDLDLTQFDLMIAHPPCTYLTNAGVRHLDWQVRSSLGNRTAVFGPARWDAMREAAAFFNWLRTAPVPRIAVENPIPHKYARELIGTYDQLVQPWMFGHGETKATCWWLKGLPPLRPTKVVKGRDHRVHQMTPGPDRWKDRSRTLPGVATALAAQWGAA